MKKLLASKYNNVVELIEETGKIPVRCIDDGDLEQLKNEIENLGYKCKLDTSTDYLLAEKLTRSELIKALKEVGSVRVNSKELQDIMPLAYDFLEEMFKGFAEEFQAFQNGEYLIDIYFNDGIVYSVGKDAQQLANEPRWAYDDYNDIETEELQELLKAAAKQPKHHFYGGIKMKTYEVFWQKTSNEIVNFHNQIRHLIDEDIIKYDFDNSTYTVPTDFTDQFLAAVEENNCTAEEV